MHELMLQDPNIPFFMVIGGTRDIPDFWKASNAQNVPYTRLAQEPILKYTQSFPMILWVNNGMVEADVSYPELSLPVIKKWMASSK